MPRKYHGDSLASKLGGRGGIIQSCALALEKELASQAVALERQRNFRRLKPAFVSLRRGSLHFALRSKRRLAEGVGFEPTVGYPRLDFESSALNRTQPPFPFCTIDNQLIDPEQSAFIMRRRGRFANRVALP